MRRSPCASQKWAERSELRSLEHRGGRDRGGTTFVHNMHVSPRCMLITPHFDLDIPLPVSFPDIILSVGSDAHRWGTTTGPTPHMDAQSPATDLLWREATPAAVSYFVQQMCQAAPSSETT